MAGTRDGNVGKTGVEQVRVNAGVGLNEDAFCGEALRAVAGDVQGAPYEHGVDTNGPIEDAGAVKDLIRQGEIGLISIANARVLPSRGHRHPGFLRLGAAKVNRLGPAPTNPRTARQL